MAQPKDEFKPLQLSLDVENVQLESEPQTGDGTSPIKNKVSSKYSNFTNTSTNDTSFVCLSKDILTP